MDYFSIGQRIRKTRKVHGLSQEALAEEIGISTTHMSHIETGNTKLSLPVLVDISRVLEVPADDLLFEHREIDRKKAMNEIVRLLDSCSTQELKIMEDVLRAVRTSLKIHLT